MPPYPTCTRNLLLKFVGMGRDISKVPLMLCLCWGCQILVLKSCRGRHHALQKGMWCEQAPSTHGVLFRWERRLSIIACKILCPRISSERRKNMPPKPLWRWIRSCVRFKHILACVERTSTSDVEMCRYTRKGLHEWPATATYIADTDAWL